MSRPLAVSYIALSALALAACNDNAADPKSQIGANPPLPELRQYLVPPIKIAQPAEWGNDTPSVPDGLQIHALASGFSHPRSLYVLPNGDVLVVETNGPQAPIHRPKDFITGWVENKAGARGPSANRITLIRQAKDGQPALRTVFWNTSTRRSGWRLSGMIFM